MKTFIPLLSALFLGIAMTGTGAADRIHEGVNGSPGMIVQARAGAQQISEGTVRKVKARAGKITIAHGPLANLGMPPMTMTFDVRNKALLKGVRVGDKVRFRAEQAGNALVVTALTVVR
jgi:Cu/Ag efflux protein CusF